ncbi:MAG: transcription termination factor Rho [Agathobacter sp.]|nr:transcription termination factor Rho [Agathobacter sp.]
MREKYESLSLTVLKDLAKARGLKGISTMKKSALVELMLEEDERDKAKAEEKARAAASEEKSAPAKRSVYSVARGYREGGDSSSRENAHGGSERPSRPGRTERTERPPMGRAAREENERPSMGRTAREEPMRARQVHTDSAEPAERAETEGYAPREDVDFAVVKEDIVDLDSGNTVNGILEVMADGFGFIRCENYMPGENDVYVAPSQIRRFNLKSGDVICGNTKVKTEREKFAALLYVTTVNGLHPSEAQKRRNFEDMTPIFPNQRLRMERPGGSVAMRVVDVIAPIGKGQRGMIVSQPKAGKTTLLKEIAKSVTINNPEMHLLILLIDERPEEVTDIREAIIGDKVEVIYSTFDETAEHHKRVSEMVIERAKRLVEHGQDVMILLDSITRLTRAYNLTVQPSGRTLSGGLDPAALHMPKRFFGAARKMREGGSLTILATALVETGSKMDDMVFEEFKGTGNMELVLDRKLSEKRIFPAVDIVKSGTRRDDLLLDAEEQIGVDNMRKALNGLRSDEAAENILNMFAHTKSNVDFIRMVQKNRIV